MKKSRTSVLILAIHFLFIKSLYGNSPLSNDGGRIGGLICLACAVENPDNAMDGDLSTFQNYELTLGALTFGETMFDFESDIPSSSIISLVVSFPDLIPNSFGEILGVSVFENTEISLLDSSENVIFTFKASNSTAVEVIDSDLNLLAIKIINPYSDVRKVIFKSGGIISAVGDVRLHEISYSTESFNFVDRNLDFGYFNGTSIVSLDLGHQVTNPDFAIFSEISENYDVNSDYTSFKYLLDANLGTEYLFSKYDWTGANYSGLENDVYIMLEDANLLAASDIKLLFDSGMIDIVVGYLDGTTETFGNGNPFVSAETQVLGSGRFYLQIDVDDTKLINNVEVRFQPFVSLASELRLYSIFLASPFVGNPLPVDFLGMDVQTENQEALVTWSTASEVDCDYFALKHFDSNGDLIRKYIIKGSGTTQELTNYSMNIQLSLEELTYVQLSQVDFNGTKTVLETESITSDATEIMIYPNPTNGIVNINGPTKESLVLISEDGKLIQNLTMGENMINSSGKYFVIDKDTGENHQTILVIK